MGRSGHSLIETLRGMMAIKLNLRESERRTAYLNHVVDHTDADVRVQDLALLQRPPMFSCSHRERLVVWLGAYAMLDNQLSVGMLFAFLLFKLFFITHVNNLVDNHRVPDARLHADRVADIALAEPESAASCLRWRAQYSLGTVHVAGARHRLCVRR